MKTRCRECKTIYDNSEKYCPFCFARTNPSSKTRVRIDGERFRQTNQVKKYAKIMDTSDTKCCKEKKTTTHSSYKKKQSPSKQKSSAVSVVIAILVILFQILAIIFE